jgi:hypothetical protein
MQQLALHPQVVQFDPPKSIVNRARLARLSHKKVDSSP